MHTNNITQKKPAVAVEQHEHLDDKPPGYHAPPAYGEVDAMGPWSRMVPMPRVRRDDAFANPTYDEPTMDHAYITVEPADERGFEAPPRYVA